MTTPYSATSDSSPEDGTDALRNKLSKMSEEERHELWISLTKTSGDTEPKTKSDYMRGHSPVHIDTTRLKLKNFSGEKPGPGEADYKHWRRAAIQIINDDSLNLSRKRLYILQSLTGTAEDAVDLHRDKPVTEIIGILDKVFGATTDGTDLLANFFQCCQKPGQPTSDYVNALYVLLCDMVKQDCLQEHEVSDLLARQFLRSTSDDEMLATLRLEEQDPKPQYPDLIHKVRREESRRKERRLRLKIAARCSATTLDSNKEPQPPSSPKPSTRALPETLPATQLDSELTQLRQRVAQLEAQQSTKVFCYRCGEDGHMAYDCRGAPNKALVEEKTSRRQQRRKNKRSGNANLPFQRADANGRE